MTTLILIDLIAGVVFLIGLHIAFRQTLVRRWWARLRHTENLATDDEDVASVLRIAGVMIMAFAFTLGAFANLIVHYSSLSRR